MGYEYITDNNLYNKQTYMYSHYDGTFFINEYLNSRNAYLEGHKEKAGCVDGGVKREVSSTQQNLEELLFNLKYKKCNQETVKAVNNYTKSFEVRKRIYTDYDDNWKPLDYAGFEEYECYLLFADCLVSIYSQTDCLKYFSCLLKIDDTLLSIQNKLDDSAKEYLSRIIVQELKIFYLVADKNGIYWEVGK